MPQVHLVFPGNTLTIQTYFYHVYFDVRLKLHDLGISLPHENGFSKVKNSYIKSDYYSICDDYGVNADERCIPWIMVVLVTK